MQEGLGKPTGIEQKPDRASAEFRPARWRLWCFRLAAIASGLAVVVSFELLLVLFHVGHEVDLVVPVAGAPKRAQFQLNPWADFAYFGMIPLSGPEPRRFDLPKPSDVYRIIVYGGSTVAGFPYPFELSFPRHLEVALQRQLDDRRVEVLNAGITAINSFSLIDMVRQGMAADPDLIVIHTGHNEFYGPGGAASSARGISPSLYPWLVRLKRLRCAQLVGRSLMRRDEQRELIQIMPDSIEIPFESATYKKVEACFRRNLSRIVDVAAENHVPVVLTTVACNLRDQSPIHPLSSAALSQERFQTFSSLVYEAEAQRDSGRFTAALEILDRAEAINDTSAVVAYRKGQCLESLKRWDEAQTEYARARDLDGCRFRAPSSFSRIVEDVARSARREDVYFLDTGSELQQRTGPQTLGHNLFLEYLHYNLEGHWQLALALAEFIQQRVLARTWHPDRVPDFKERDALLAATLQDRLFAVSTAITVLQTAPLATATDAWRQHEFLTSFTAGLYSQLSPKDQDIFADLSMQEMDSDLTACLADRYEKSGDIASAVDWWERKVTRQPWSAEGHRQLARLLTQQGRLDRARRHRLLAADLAPTR